MKKAKGFGNQPSKQNPHNNKAESAYQLGVSLMLQEDWAGAQKALSQAVAAQINRAEAYTYLAVVCRQRGSLDLPQIADLFRQSLKLNPNYLEAYYNLGVVLSEQGLLTQANSVYLELLKRQPDSVEAYYDIGVNYAKQGLLSQAEECFVKVVQIKPNYPEAHYNLGMTLKQQGLLDRAKQSLQQAIALNPNYFKAYNNLGVIYQEEGKLSEAKTAFRNALEKDIDNKADYAEVYNNLGITLSEEGLIPEATVALRKAVALKPDYVDAYCHLGLTLAEDWLLTEALATIRQALTLKPDDAKAHYHLGSMLLLTGELKEGFKEYEWRWLAFKTHYPQFKPPVFKQPVWDGSSLVGKTILLLAEQGLGDTLQFVRYATLVSELGGRVKLGCPPELVELLKNVKGIGEVISLTEAENAEFDVYIPLLSLPYILGTTLETIPSQIPYITCEKSLALPVVRGKSLKVGIVWASGYRSHNLGLYFTYMKKSCDLALFLELLDIRGVRLYSLQVGKDANEFETLLPNPRLVNLSPQIQDFTDTAAFVNQLDLVITVDTSVAHLVGAMGKPVWLLLPYFCDWRWLESRLDSPWYPTMRLFRQSQRGDWQGVFQQLKEALTEFKPTPKSSSTKKLKATQKRNLQADRLWKKGLKLLDQGNFQEAENAIRQAISLDNNQPEYHYHLGMSLHPQGLFAEAAEALKAAITLKPDWDQALNNLGAMYIQMGLDTEAEEVYQKAIALNPISAGAYYNLGIIWQKRGLFDEAKESYQAAIAVNPNFAMAYNSLGSIILSQEEPTEEAFSFFQKAIALQPNYVEAHSNLGLYYFKKRLFLQAEQTYNHCISLRPNDPELYFNLGVVFKNQLLLKPAEIAYRKAISLKADHGNAHYNLASVLLIQGDLSQGFAEYEWRWRGHTVVLPTIAQPMWDGSNPQGKTILVVSEQGLGDTLQFIRYAPLLTRLGARVKLTCREGLVRLLARVEGVTEVIPVSETVVCDCDYFVPIMSLPYLFGTTMATIPSQVPYITLNFHNQTHLPGEEESQNQEFKIGIVWASGKYTSDENSRRAYQEKSVPLEMFMQFLELPKVKLYSLQVGNDAQEIQKYLDNPRVVDLSPHIKDFYDTAELIKQLDLVISVDTSVAHLAGAMGKPVWLLLLFYADWRWLLTRNDSPWYPTMRLFRQAKRGDWAGVFTEVQQALEFSTSLKERSSFYEKN